MKTLKQLLKQLEEKKTEFDEAINAKEVDNDKIKSLNSEINELEESIKELQAKEDESNEKINTKGNSEEDLIDNITYDKILSKIGGEKFYGKLEPSKEDIKKIIDEKELDISDAKDLQTLCDTLYNYISNELINSVPNNHIFKNNSKVQDMLPRLINGAIKNLPDAKILVQEILKGYGTSEYENALDGVFQGFEYIDGGAGKDLVQDYLPTVDILDTSSNNYFPSRKNINEHTATYTVTLPDTIYRSYLTVTSVDYVKYFLSGKISEWVKHKIGGLVLAIKMKQYLDCCKLLNGVYKALKALPASTDNVPTQHIVSETVSFIDAWGEVKILERLMKQQNKRFLYQNDNEYAEYTWLEKPVKIVPLKVLNTIEKYMTTMLTKDKLLADFMGKVHYLPTTVKDTLNNELVDCNVFTDTVGGEEVPNDNCVMILDGKFMVRLYNLSLSNTTELPIALTSIPATFMRYTQDIAPFCSCALYENTAGALTSNFVIPTKEESSNSNLKGLGLTANVSKIKKIKSKKSK